MLCTVGSAIKLGGVIDGCGVASNFFIKQFVFSFAPLVFVVDRRVVIECRRMPLWAVRIEELVVG